jgi:hypothetical protein
VGFDEMDLEKTLETVESKLQPLLEIDIEGILEANRLGKDKDTKKRLV